MQYLFLRNNFKSNSFLYNPNCSNSISHSQIWECRWSKNMTMSHYMEEQLCIYAFRAFTVFLSKLYSSNVKGSDAIKNLANYCFLSEMSIFYTIIPGDKVVKTQFNFSLELLKNFDVHWISFFFFFRLPNFIKEKAMMVNL